MKLFISWSGERSKLLAEGLYKWLPRVINAVEPWLSSSDIEPGARWAPELANQLEETKYGIICVTADNLNAPWLLFESGALSRYVEKARVVPLSLDLKVTEIKGPLSQFQGIQATESDIKKMVIAINLTVFASDEKGVERTGIDEVFGMWWPRLKQSIQSIPKAIQTAHKTERSEREMIEEILLLARKANSEREQVGPLPTYPVENFSRLDTLSRNYEFLTEAERAKAVKEFLETYYPKVVDPPE